MVDVEDFADEEEEVLLDVEELDKILVDEIKEVFDEELVEELTDLEVDVTEEWEVVDLEEDADLLLDVVLDRIDVALVPELELVLLNFEVVELEPKLDATACEVPFLMYTLSLFPAPQYSYGLPEQVMEQSESAVKTEPVPNESAHQHCCNISTPIKTIDMNHLLRVHTQLRHTYMANRRQRTTR